MRILQTILLISLAIFTTQTAHAAVAPMPLISRNVPAYASDSSAQAGQANNANYDDNWRSNRTPSSGSPNWLAYDLSSKHPTTVVIVWYNDGTYGYNWDLQGGQGYSVPTDYTIDVNSAAGGTLPASGWTTAVTVTGSHYHSREHTVNMTGKNWIRINVTGASTASQNTDVSINMDVYDTSAGIQDTWLFTGDSITAGGMKHTGTTFSQGVNAGDSHFPLEENAGIGGWTASLVLGQIDSWLAIYPGHFVTINLGTNDVNSSPGDNTAINACLANLTAIANKVIAAGKVPIIPHIPWANLAAIQSNGPVLNSKIDALIAGNPQIIAGPDLYAFFQANPGLISSDNLHPSDPAGWAAYRNQWSSWAISKIYGGTITIPPAPTGLTATAANTQVALAWNVASSATSYNAKRSTVSGSGYANVATGIATTNYTNTGLTNGTTYYFVVSATNSAGTSGNSAQASATPNLVIPAAPTGLTATPGNTQAVLSWNASAGATSYNVKRSTVNGSGYATISSPATTSYTNTGLTNGVTYYYVVTAVNSAGQSANSSQVSATPTSSSDTAQYNFEAGVQGWTATGGLTSGVAASGTQKYLGAQSLAVNFNGTAAGTATVSVASPGAPDGATVTYHVWIPSGSTITDIKPYVSGGTWTGGYIGIGAVTLNAWNTFTVTIPTGMAPDTSLGFQIDLSGAWTGTCYIDSVGWPAGGGAPAAPTGLTATPGSGQVSLAWNSSSGATSYNVKRSTVNGSGYATAASPTTNSYVNVNLINGTTYYFVVTAVNASGESGNSNQVSATPSTGIPAPPTGLTATAGNAQAALSWTASGGAASYNIYRGTSAGGESGTAIATGVTTTSYTNTGLTNGTKYYFTVKAVNASGTSGASNEASATPAASGDTAQYNFESGVQGWTSTGGITSGVAASTTQKYLGAQSLAVNFNGAAAGTAVVSIASPGIPDGKIITWHVWIPSGSTITDIKPYVAGGSWTGDYVAIGGVTLNAWNTYTLTIPAGMAPDTSVGIQFDLSGAWTGTCYIDSVSW